MSNPTTPFSWQMPTATDLVTDLPADFEVFGQAVATSMADLLGGTSGQILAKNSNTDMDFVWIANDQGDITGITATAPLTGGGSSGAVTVGIQDALTTQKGAVQLSDSTSTTSSILAATPTAVKSAYDLADGAIAKSTVTTAGDIIYRNATVPVRLGIGTAGQVLQVNSGATAPEWATPAGGGSAGTTFISRTTFSNVASQILDGIFTSSYEAYIVIIEELSASSGTTQIQWRYGASTQTGSDYYGGMYFAGRTASALTFSNTSAGTQFKADDVIGNSGEPSFGLLQFARVGNTSEVPLCHGYLVGNGMTQSHFSFRYDTAGTATGFLIKSSAANITGAITVLGVNKS